MGVAQVTPQAKGYFCHGIFCKFLHAQPYTIPEWENIVTFRLNVRPKYAIYIPKRDEEHPHPFHMRNPPRAFSLLTQIFLFCMNSVLLKNLGFYLW